MLFIIYFSVSSLAKTQYPATFATEDYQLSTLKQFQDRFQSKHPSFENEFYDIGKLEYRGGSYAAKELHTVGVQSGEKYIQTLTYIERYTGLWKLIYTESQRCTQGPVPDGKGGYENSWGCDDIKTPISGVYADVFIVDNKHIDIDQLSQEWGREVYPYEGASESITETAAKSSKDRLLSLGDMKEKIENAGGSWDVKETTWSGSSFNPKPEQPALIVHVKVNLDSVQTLDQSFLYLIKADKLHLKEIDGQVCRWVERMQKDICDPLRSPTPVTNFKIQLLNSLESSHSVVSDGIDSSSPSQFQCGHLKENFQMILKFHFEASIFSFDDLKDFRRFFAAFPKIADPQGLLLSDEVRKNYAAVTNPPYPKNELIHTIQKEINKGVQGDCSALVPYIEDLKQKVLESSQQAYLLLNTLKEKDFALNAISESSLNERQKVLLNHLLKQRKEKFLKGDPKQALDVAASYLDRELKMILSRLSHYEEFVTAAMAKRDAYSGLFENNQALDATFNEIENKKYFGVSIEKGFSGRFYLGRVHPTLKKQTGLAVGHEILLVNGQVASHLSYEEFDKILLNSSASINWRIATKKGSRDITLKAQNIDPLRYFYSLEFLNSQGNEYLKIKVATFNVGLVKSLSKAIEDKLAHRQVDGFILDLRNNNGGNVEEAINLMSLFVKDKTLAYSRIGPRLSGKKPDAYNTKEKYFLSEQLPLAVQVNYQTRSSSEIVTSGLKSLNRSITVGGQTFGKLVGRYYVPLNLSTGLELGLMVSAVEFFSPLGESLNGIGIAPDLYTLKTPERIFDDGIEPGQNYRLPGNSGLNLYPNWLSREALKSLQSEIKIGKVDTDKVTLEVLDQVNQTELSK